MYNFTKSVDEGTFYFYVKDSYTICCILIIIQPPSGTISHSELGIKISSLVPSLVDDLYKSKTYPVTRSL